MMRLFSFKGRIARLQYLAIYLGGLGLLLGIFFAMSSVMDIRPYNDMRARFAVAVALVLSIPVVWVTTAALVKRLHDAGQTGLWILVGIVPYLGALGLLFYGWFARGDDGDNEFGPPPDGSWSDVLGTPDTT